MKKKANNKRRRYNPEKYDFIARLLSTALYVATTWYAGTHHEVATFMIAVAALLTMSATYYADGDRVEMRVEQELREEEEAKRRAQESAERRLQQAREEEFTRVQREKMFEDLMQIAEKEEE